MINIKKIIFIFDYYFYKGKNKIYTLIFERIKKFQMINNLAIFNLPDNFQFSKKVIFCFWDPKLVHLGDQLFYQPVIDFLNKQFQVEIITYSAMKNYFSSLGYKTYVLDEKENEKIEGAILITTKDMFWEITRKFSKNNIFFGIEFSSPPKAKRVVEIIFEIILEVFKKLNISCKTSDLDNVNLCPIFSSSILEKYKNSSSLKIFLENLDKKFFLFNNYIFSRFIGIGPKRKKMLEDLAKEKKKEGYLIVHTGSKKDKETDRKKYDFIDYDLRGITEPLELFKILSLDNVYGVISFDTFIMHVASMLRKDLYIVIKSRLTGKKNENIIKIFVPMASCFKNLIKFVK